MDNTSQTSTAGRIWYVLGGILSIFVGIFAIEAPVLMTLAIAKVVGLIALASGIVLFFAAIFGKARQHRLLDFFSAVLRIIVGLLLVSNVVAAAAAITLLLGSVFLVEGVFSLFLGFKMRGMNPAWGWVAFNGAITLILGVMLIAQLPSSALWAVGLLFGINCIFNGLSLIMCGTAMQKA